MNPSVLLQAAIETKSATDKLRNALNLIISEGETDNSEIAYGIKCALSDIIQVSKLIINYAQRIDQDNDIHTSNILQ